LILVRLTLVYLFVYTQANTCCAYCAILLLEIWRAT
jgi:hypothetical protein